MPDPIVAVMADKFTPGIDNLDSAVMADALPLEPLPLSQALERTWGTDAHFVGYYATPDQGILPRCNKPVLSHIRKAACDLVTEVMVFDYDNEGHAPWTGPGDTGPFYERLMEAMDRQPAFRDWRHIYFTKHGARLIYVLNRPVPVDDYEEYHRWCVNEWHKLGFKEIDELNDWTRLYRLPKVNRDGDSTGEAAYFDIMSTTNVMDLALLGRTAKTGKVDYSLLATEYADSPPDDGEAYQFLFHQQANGSQVQTEFYKAAKKKLRHHDCYGVCFDGRSIGDKGSRDQNILRFVGQAVAYMAPDKLACPEAIYALFVRAINELEPDAHTPDWRAVLWSAVCRVWHKECCLLAEKQAEEEAEEAQQLSALESIVQGMKTWCKHPDLDGSEEERVAYVKRHSILSVAGYYYLMGLDGRYQKTHLMDRQLIAAIRNSPSHGIYQTTKLNQQNQIVDRSSGEIINEYATVASCIRGSAGEDGGYISDIDMDAAIYHMRLYRRNAKIQPEFNRDVDNWMRYTFGEHYKFLRRWIGFALAFEDGPMCALSIEAPPGIGKKMLVQGLAECLEQPSLAGVDDMVGANNYNLLTSPFMAINEGWPKSKAMEKQPADAFRALIGGDPVECKRKYSPPVQLRIAMRLIFTANNTNTIRQITGTMTLSPEDRQALAQRLTHIKLPPESVNWIEEQGGKALTGVPGNRWIAEDTGHNSDYVLAKHFMWLYHNRGEPDRGRFLVHGNASDTIMFMLRSQAGAAPAVLEAIIKLIHAKTNNKAQKYKGIYINHKQGEIHVLTRTIIDYYREELMTKTGDRLSPQDAADVLRSLIRKEHASRILPNAEVTGRRNWHDLDVLVLAMVAENEGYDCPVLTSLSDVQKEKQT